MTWYTEPTRYLLFTGKGGVGKTSLACATAVHLADKGRRVLLVSTDPASNLDHVFGATIGTQDPTAISVVPGLHVLNIDPDAAAQAYRERVVGPMRGILPDSVVRNMEEQLSGACTTEIAAFDEFTELLTDTTKIEAFDHVIFDTAPTGHTVRLMTLPSAWSTFLDANQSGTSCLGPLSGLEKQRIQYAKAVETLSSSERTTLVLVCRPQRTTLQEAARTSLELAALGITNQRLIVNGLMSEGPGEDSLANAMREHDRGALAAMPEALKSIAVDYVPLHPMNMIGMDSLRRLLTQGPVQNDQTITDLDLEEIDALSLGELVDAMDEDGHGLVMVMGKGGVGKTTLASAIAVELAARGNDVHLTTTDPAAHVDAAIGSEVDRLQVSRIDPQLETERYRKHVLESKGKDLDEQGRALLEEDLRSPCTEEIAVFEAFSRVIRESNTKFVVVDTAPTGHTLLLLDAAGAYHRDVMRHTREREPVQPPLMRLQDPAQTKLLIVTLPETTPVLEAASLQEDLRRAGIEPWAWVVNASLAAANPSDSLLRARAQQEYAQVTRVQREMTLRLALVPWVTDELAGHKQLMKITQTAPVSAFVADTAGTARN